MYQESCLQQRQESISATVLQEQHVKIWPFTLQETEHKPVAQEDFQDVTGAENLSQKRRQKKYWAKLAQ